MILILLYLEAAPAPLDSCHGGAMTKTHHVTLGPEIAILASRTTSVTEYVTFYKYTTSESRALWYNTIDIKTTVKRGMSRTKQSAHLFSWPKLVQKHQKNHNANETTCNSPWDRGGIGQIFFVWKGVVDMTLFFHYIRLFGTDCCIRTIDSGGTRACRGRWCRWSWRHLRM